MGEELQPPPPPVVTAPEATDPTPVLSEPQAASSPKAAVSRSLSMGSSAAITGAVIGSPSYGAAAAANSFLFPGAMPGGMFGMMPTPPGPATLDSLAQQLFGLQQIVTGLVQRVSDNQRLFEENMRLKDVVIDLEFKLREANHRAADLDSLRTALTAQFSELGRSLRSGGGGGGAHSTSQEALNVSGTSGVGGAEGGEQFESLLNMTMTPEPPLPTDGIRLEPGTLNLQNREMTVIPEDVYKLNDPELLKTLVGEGDDLKWWETEPIAKLYLCSNKIATITPAISGLGSLTLLDLRDNQIEVLPDAMSQLESLIRLELSHNRLTTLPSSLSPSLQHLSLNNNNFDTFPEAIASLANLATLDIRENKIGALGTLPPSLESLVADDNKLTTVSFEGHPNITALTVNSNQLTSCRVGNNPKLKVLALKINKLEHMEPLVACPALQELLVGKNFLASLEFIAPCATTLTVLDCSDNKVSSIPGNITGMSALRRLDLTNNDLNSLPPELALMEGLTSLAVEGNPLRTIRREILAKGTVAIKEYLKLKLDPGVLEEAGPTVPDIQPDEVMLQTKTLELDRKMDIANELWDQALVCGIVRLSLQHCALASVPEQVFNLRGSLQELELGQNNIRELPPDMGKMLRLRKLNLVNNNIKELPGEMSALVALEDFNLSHNKLTEIPEQIYSMTALCSLILSNNQIAKVDPSKLIGLTSLVCIDLENNNIGRLPPELSLIPNLRTLLVMGNSFKIPRADVLARGSSEVIAWLKNKVPL